MGEYMYYTYFFDNTQGLDHVFTMTGVGPLPVYTPVLTGNMATGYTITYQLSVVQGIRPDARSRLIDAVDVHICRSFVATPPFPFWSEMVLSVDTYPIASFEHPLMPVYEPFVIGDADGYAYYVAYVCTEYVSPYPWGVPPVYLPPIHLAAGAA